MQKRLVHRHEGAKLQDVIFSAASRLGEKTQQPEVTP
jgi:hypothetical protein